MKTFKLLISDNPKARDICADLMVVCHTALEEGASACLPTMPPNFCVSPYSRFAPLSKVSPATRTDSLGR